MLSLRSHFHAIGHWLLLGLLTCASHGSYGEKPLHLRLIDPQQVEPESTRHYYIRALELALSKTATANEKLQFHFIDQSVGRERVRAMIMHDELDVMWSSSTREREEHLEAVKFNLLRGINEYRFLLIRKQDQARFKPIHDLEGLRKFTLGSGTHWSDTDIFRRHGFRVVTAWNHESLFRMLAAKRFDFMARTYNEIQREIRERPELNLVVENHLLLRYEQPIYFFVHKNNQELARRLERGLQLAQADGSLGELFFSIEEFKDAWNALQHMDRTIIHLPTFDRDQD